MKYYFVHSNATIAPQNADPKYSDEESRGDHTRASPQVTCGGTGIISTGLLTELPGGGIL